MEKARTHECCADCCEGAPGKTSSGPRCIRFTEQEESAMFYVENGDNGGRSIAFSLVDARSLVPSAGYLEC